MRILLVAMPWHSLDTPSLAVGILHERVQHCREQHEVKDLYAHIKWAEFLNERSEGVMRSYEYTAIAEGGIFHGLGDWLFTPALYGTPEWRVEQYSEYMKKAGRWSDKLLDIHRWSPEFIDQLARQVVELKPDMVGFTSTFMQNVASLALARRLKQLEPRILTIMGGANCDGPQGLAVHRNFPFLDFVVRGEGEQTFVELLDALGGHGSVEEVLGLCWRDQEGNHRANPDRTHAFPAHQIPAPNYDAYFDTVSKSKLRVEFQPKLVMEGARGCWWGEKHHCTFCGLNGSMMAFRSKPPAQLWEEIRATIERHQTLDILMVDNIIDHKYFKALLPHITQSGINLRMHYEVKSNLNTEQIQALKDAGVVNVQPGIENLSTRVLKLMAKGINGCHNVQTLRDCEDQGLTVSWNYLYGFPGETEEDYVDIVAQVPAMVHLQPPGGATRIALERFSPNFENPAIGFVERRPAPFYFHVYDLPEHELMDLAYIFETPPKGITGEVTKRLAEAVKQWKESYTQSELSYRDDGRHIYLRDRRVGWPERDVVLVEPSEVALFRLLLRPQSPATAAESLRSHGHEVTPEQVTQKLADWRKEGLAFEEGGRFICLPLRARPQRVRAPAGKKRMSLASHPEGLPQGAHRPLPVPQLTLAQLGLGQPVGSDCLVVSLQPAEWEQLLPALEAQGGTSAVAVRLQGDMPLVWPSSLYLAQLAARGVVEVQVPWEVEIGAQQHEQAIHFIRFLRDCTAQRLRVRWLGRLTNGVGPRTLLHLDPPALAEGQDVDERLRLWNDEHAYGRCFWRMGQRFLFIKDLRPARDANRFTLDQGPLYEVFTRLSTPHRMQDFEHPEHREALQMMLEEDLLLQLGDWVVALPYQIRHWPIPFGTL